MNINRDNYEIWFLDFVEDKLSEAEISALDVFLLSNPDLKAELDEFEIININQVETHFPDKDFLKKDINPKYSAEDFIAYHEGDLNSVQKDEIDTYLKDDSKLKKEFDSYASVYLQADLSQQYPDKTALKKKETVVIAMYLRYIAVAASILFAVTLYYFNNSEQAQDITLADNDKDTSTKDNVNTSASDITITSNDNLKDVVADLQDTDSVEKVNDKITSNSTANHPEKRSKINRMNTSRSVAQHIMNNTTIDAINKENTRPIESIDLKEIDLNQDIAYISLKNELRETSLPSVTEDKTPSRSKIQTITALAYVEKKIATKISNGKKDKLNLFEVLQKIGDKSNLYSLSNDENTKYNLKIAGASIIRRKYKG